MTVEDHRSRLRSRVHCADCGTALAEGGRFCPGCGSRSTPDGPMPGAVAVGGPGGRPLWRDETVPLSVFDDVAADEGEAHIEEKGGPGRPRWRAHRPTGSRGWLAVAAVGLVLLLIAGLGASAGYRHLRDQPAREAFAAAEATYAPIARGLQSANGVEEVAAVGQRAVGAIPLLEADRLRATDVGSATGRRITAAIAAQKAVASAVGALRHLGGDNLASWGVQHTALASALGHVDAARRTAAPGSSPAVGVVPSGTAVLKHLESVVGTAVADAAETSTTGLLAELGSAKQTAQVRTAAAAAAREVDSDAAAARSMPAGGAQAAHLQALAAVCAEVAKLSILDGDSLADWPGIRQSLTTSLGGVVGDRSVTSAGSDAVDNVNRLVSDAQTRLADWKAAYASAVHDRTAATAALETYSTKVEAQLRTYTTLRGDLSAWITRMEDRTVMVTYDDAYAALSQAQWDRQSVRDALNRLQVPSSMESSNAGLVAVLDDATSALQAAYDGARDANYCVTACYYADTPGWRTFRAESARITGSFSDAVDAWEAALASARASVAAQVLPRQPIV